MPTALYKRIMDWNDSDDEWHTLMREVWSVTPWVTDAFTGSIAEDRYREMRFWCREQFGDEASPIHGREGTWQFGGATIHGWTWVGFATEAQLRQFQAAWPSATT